MVWCQPLSRSSIEPFDLSNAAKNAVRHFIALVMSCCCHECILLLLLLVRNGGGAWKMVTNYRGTVLCCSLKEVGTRPMQCTIPNEHRDRVIAAMAPLLAAAADSILRNHFAKSASGRWCGRRRRRRSSASAQHPRSPPQHCPVFPPKTGIFSKKNREAIEHERANH